MFRLSTKLAFSAFRRSGVPAALRTGNGYPFAGVRIVGLCDLSAWLLKFGVMPARNAPGQPQQNARQERMRRTLKAAAINLVKENIRAQRKAFDHFRHEYNFERPPDALNDQIPYQIFVTPTKQFPNRLPDVEYPDHFLTRSVRTEGAIRWKGGLIYLSKPLIKERVGLELIDENLWQI